MSVRRKKRILVGESGVPEANLNSGIP